MVIYISYADVGYRGYRGYRGWGALFDGCKREMGGEGTLRILEYFYP